MANNPLLRPYFKGGGGIGVGVVPLYSHDGRHVASADVVDIPLSQGGKDFFQQYLEDHPS